MGRGKPPSPQTTNEMKRRQIPFRLSEGEQPAKNDAAGIKPFATMGTQAHYYCPVLPPPLPTEKQLETQTINFSKVNLSDINRATNAPLKT